MRPNKKILMLFVWLITSVLPAFAITEKATIGKPTPNFEATTYNDETLSLKDYRGKTVIVYFWGTWAGKTIATNDVPLLQYVFTTYATDIQVIGVNHFDTDADAKSWLSENDVTYPNLIDENGTIARLMDVEDIPTTFIIDPDGVLRSVLNGTLRAVDLKTALSDYVAIDLPSDSSNTVVATISAEAMARYADLPSGLTAQGFPVLGNSNAPIVIEGFMSFACPSCFQFHNRVFLDLVERIREEDIAYVYIPIYVTGDIPNSLNANKASLCVAEQDQFWIYQEMLYDWHGEFGRTAFVDVRLRAGAEALELDMVAWDACMDTIEPENRLDQAIEIFRQRGYLGTPTVSVNGEAVDASIDAIFEAIDRARGSNT